MPQRHSEDSHLSAPTFAELSGKFTYLSATNEGALSETVKLSLINTNSNHCNELEENNTIRIPVWDARIQI